MTGLLCSNGEQVALGCFLNKTTPVNAVLHLYQNNHTPAYADTVSSYTEATFTGYSSATLTGASWSLSGTDPATASYAQQSFASTANQTAQVIYGYYLTVSGNLIAAELFASSITIQYNGDTINVTPTINAT
jgi:hypothetical protein